MTNRIKTEAVHARVTPKGSRKLMNMIFYRVLGHPVMVTQEKPDGSFEVMQIDPKDKEAVKFADEVFETYERMKQRKE